MMLTLHIQLVQTFVEQMLSDTPFSLIPFENGINQIYSQVTKNLFKKFRNTLLKLGRPTPDLMYRIHHPLGLNLLTRLRLVLSHLNEHRFKHTFKKCINPLCTCSLKVESTKHFFLHCLYYSALRISFLNDLNNILPQFALFLQDVFIKTLLSGNTIFDENDNQEILETSIRYILDSKRFSGGL